MTGFGQRSAVVRRPCSDVGNMRTRWQRKQLQEVLNYTPIGAAVGVVALPDVLVDGRRHNYLITPQSRSFSISWSL